MAMTYRSVTDRRRIVVTALCCSLPILSGFGLMAAGEALGFAAMVLVGGGISVAGALVLWSWLSVGYEITVFDLVLRSGLRRRRIPLECIVGAHSTRILVGAPYRPVDRVAIAYRKRGRDRVVMISPEGRVAFLRELAAAAPFLESMGEDLVRTPALRLTS